MWTRGLIDGQTGRQTDLTKLTVAIRDFFKASKIACGAN